MIRYLLALLLSVFVLSASQAQSKVRYTLDCFKVGTTEKINTVHYRERFEVGIAVQDLRDDSSNLRGIYATYTDLTFDWTYVSQLRLTAWNQPFYRQHRHKPEESLPGIESLLALPLYSQHLPA